MSIWLQKGQDRAYHLVPDGRTRTDLLAMFYFSQADLVSVPTVRFRIGAGNVLDDNGRVKQFETEQEIFDAVKLVEGLELSSSGKYYSNHLIRANDNSMSVQHAAKTTILPVPTSIKTDEAVVVAYCGYDLSGDTTRLAVQAASFSISTVAPEVAPVMAYNLAGTSWTEKSSMTIPREGAFCESDGSSIYVIGGYSSGFLSVNESFDGTDWSSSVSAPTARAYGTCTLVNGYLYLIGGIGSDGASKKVERFDPSSGEWDELSSAPTPMAFHCAKQYGNSIYVLFGCMSVNSGFFPEKFNSGVLKYDIQSDAWEYQDVIVPSGISTTLTAIATAGDGYLRVSSSMQFPPSGVVTLQRGGAAELSVAYVGYDSGDLVLAEPLSSSFPLGATVNQASFSYGRLSPGSFLSSAGEIVTFNGIPISLVTGNEEAEQNARETYDLATKSATFSASGAATLRYRTAEASDAAYSYIAGGSDLDSDWNFSFERVSLATGAFSTLASCPRPVFGAASALMGGDFYLIGGSTTLRPEPWYRIIPLCQPSSMVANGMQDAALSFQVEDSQGNPCPDGTTVVVSTVILAEDSSGNELARIPSEPVLMTSTSVTTSGGKASLIVKPRGEDYLKGVMEAKGSLPAVIAGEQSLLYRILLTGTIDGVASTNEYATSSPGTRIGTTNKVIFSPDQVMAQQGASSRLGVVTDSTSIPDSQVIVEDALASLAKTLLDEEKTVIPSGCSPFYDGMFLGAQSRIPFPTTPPTNMIVGITDEYQNNSSNDAGSVASEANSAIGEKEFPIFVVGLSMDRPVNLSARSNTTDVPEYDTMAEQTGGDSYSLVDPSYSSSIIARIKAEASSSPGRGTITITHAIDGFLVSVEYTVSNMIPGNSSSMSLSYTSDGRQYHDLGQEVSPNSTYALPEPVLVSSFTYVISLSSQTFDSPVLGTASFVIATPTSQYVFTYPISVSGEVSEIAGVVNHRISSPGSAKLALCHGASTYFDGDYSNSVADRGVILMPNRSTDTVADNQVTTDIMDTQDLILYKARGGPWAQDAEISVFVNGEETSDYVKVPELGMVRFSRKLSASDSVTISVFNPSTFRVGVKVTNPTLAVGYLDSFAYSFGETKRYGDRSQLPRAINPMISPDFVRPGGPMEATYVYQDSNGLPEETALTQIIWYRDGSVVSELTNKRTISDADLNASSYLTYKIRKGQTWLFSVKPNDGIAFGPEVRSPRIVVQDGIPSVSKVVLVPSDGTEFLSNENITVTYTFYDPDQDADLSLIWFYADGKLVQQGASPTLLSGATDSSGIVIIKPGRLISAVVVPYDGVEYGSSVGSPEVVVGYVSPTASSVVLAPLTPSSADTLTVTYTFTDPDGYGDQSMTAWYRNEVRVTALDNLKSVLPSYTLVGQSWKVIVTPYNGHRTGTPITSSSVTIEF